MASSLLFLLLTTGLSQAQDDTEHDTEWRYPSCGGGRPDDPGQVLRNGVCGAPIMAGFCAYHYGGDCPTLASWGDDLPQPYSSLDFTGPCLPTDPVSFVISRGTNESSESYYFNHLGELVGYDAWVGLGYGCCEGEEVSGWEYGLSGPCGRWNPRKLKVEDDEDAARCEGCGGGGAALALVFGLTRRRR